MIRRILLGLALAVCAAPAAAQDAPALVEFYGDGAHAYFSGDIFEAHRLLTQAIESGIRDPRAYYFRAMTLLAMGRDTEAEADMQAGAYLEARAPSGSYDVDRSIQRIQGRDRLRLEKIRRQVRFAVEQERREEAARRYEQTQQREADVLRRHRPEEFDEGVQPAGGTAPSIPPVNSPQVGTPAPEAPPSGQTPQPAVNEQPAAEPAPALDPFSTDTPDIPGGVEEAPADAEPAADPFAPGGTAPDGGARDTGPSPFGEAPAEIPPPDASGGLSGSRTTSGGAPTSGQGGGIPADEVFGRLGQLLGRALSGGLGGSATVENASTGGVPVVPNDSPFGNSASGDDSTSPFGEEAPAAEGNPFGAGEDPFGADVPAGQQGDPFGEDSEAPAANDNPFGPNGEEADDDQAESAGGTGADSFN
jgi:hypothetical protein